MRLRMFFALSLVAAAAFAQKPDDDLLAIQDNSFLLEEAYNQEAGVIQYINVYVRDQETGEGVFAFTNELPVGSQKHQFSYTVPIDSHDDIGDIALNYRYQLVGNGSTKLAIAPRLSVLLPTGEGSDDTGIQIGIPISRVLGPRVAAHTNLGATWQNEFEFSAGQSFIYALSSHTHLMLEGVWTRSDSDHELVINPGIRWAINLSNGFQVVPGVSYAIARNGDNAALLYLSFER